MRKVSSFCGLLPLVFFCFSCQPHYVHPDTDLVCTEYTIKAGKHKDPSLGRDLPEGTDSITALITFLGDMRYSSCQIGMIDDIRDVSKVIGITEDTGWRGTKYGFGPTHAIRFGWQTDTLAEDNRVARAMAYANHPGGKHPFASLTDTRGQELYLKSGQEYEVTVIARGETYLTRVKVGDKVFSATLPRLYKGPSNPKLAMPWVGGDDPLDHDLIIRVCRDVD